MRVLPKVIHVFEREEGGDTWFEAYEGLADCANASKATLVGTYKLQEVSKISLIVKEEVVVEKAA